MDVSVKAFDVEMLVKNSGIELEVREPNGGVQIGDFIVTKAGVIWCKGRVRRENGIKLSWTELVRLIEAKPTTVVKKAAKKTASAD